MILAKWRAGDEVWDIWLASPQRHSEAALAPGLQESRLSLCGVSAAPAQAQIVHAGQACVVKEDNISERVYTIRESDTLVLQCLVTGHPRPQVSWALLGTCPAHSPSPGSRV